MNENQQLRDFEDLKREYFRYYREKFQRHVVELISEARNEQRKIEGRDFALESLDELSDCEMGWKWSPKSILGAFKIDPHKIKPLSEVVQQAEDVWKVIQKFRRVYFAEISADYEKTLKVFEEDVTNYVLQH